MIRIGNACKYHQLLSNQFIIDHSNLIPRVLRGEGAKVSIRTFPKEHGPMLYHSSKETLLTRHYSFAVPKASPIKVKLQDML